MDFRDNPLDVNVLDRGGQVFNARAYGVKADARFQAPDGAWFTDPELTTPATDDTEALADILHKVGQQHGVLYLPGLAMVSDKIAPDHDGYVVRGAGPRSGFAASPLYDDDDEDVNFLFEVPFQRGEVEIANLSFRGIAGEPFDSIHGAPSSYAINTHHCWFYDLEGIYGGPDYSSSIECLFTDSHVYRCSGAWGASGSDYGWGCRASRIVAVDCTKDGVFHIQYGRDHMVDNCYIRFVNRGGPTTTAIRIGGNAGHMVRGNHIICVSPISIYSGIVAGPNLAGFAYGVPDGITISENHIDGPSYGIQGYSLTRSAIRGNRVRNVGEIGIVLSRATGTDPLSGHNRISDNEVTGAAAHTQGIVEIAGAADENDIIHNDLRTDGPRVVQDGASTRVRDNTGFSTSTYVADAVPWPVLFGGMRSGCSYASHVGMGMGTLATAANTAWAMPIMVPGTTTFNQMSVEVLTAAAGSSLRLGIYADDGASRPGALVLDAGTQASATTGSKLFPISTTLDAGLYWLVLAAEGGTPSVRGFISGIGYMLPQTLASHMIGLLGTQAAGALNATFAYSGSTSAAPRILIRVA